MDSVSTKLTKIQLFLNVCAPARPKSRTVPVYKLSTQESAPMGDRAVVHLCIIVSLRMCIQGGFCPDYLWSYGVGLYRFLFHCYPFFPPKYPIQVSGIFLLYLPLYFVLFIRAIAISTCTIVTLQESYSIPVCARHLYFTNPTVLWPNVKVSGISMSSGSHIKPCIYFDEIQNFYIAQRKFWILI